MLQTTIEESIGEATGVETLPASAEGRGRRLLVFGLLALVLLAGVLATAWFAGAFSDFLPVEKSGKEMKAPAASAAFHDLPELLVNLDGEGRKPSFLKLSVSLELASESDRAELERRMPRVIDAFQVYLRELRVEDLRGSAGMQRLREELLLRVNTAIAPIVVRDVLFKQMLVQ